jgi:hypothetical protein
MSIFCGLIREECNIFHSQSTVKTLESASQLPYRHMWRQFAFCQEKPNKSKVSAILEEK